MSYPAAKMTDVDPLDGIVAFAAEPIVIERLDTPVESSAVLRVLGEQQHVDRFPVRFVLGPDVTYLREKASAREGGARLKVTGRPRGGSTVVLTLPVPADRAPADVAELAQCELRRLVARAATNGTRGSAAVNG